MKPKSIWNYLQECIDFCKTNNHIISNIFIIILVIFTVHICIKYTNNGMIIEGLNSDNGVHLDSALTNQSRIIFNNIVKKFKDDTEKRFIDKVVNTTFKTDDKTGNTNKKSIEELKNTLNNYIFIKKALIKDILEKKSIPVDINIKIDENSVREKFKIQSEKKQLILKKLKILKNHLEFEQRSIMTNTYNIPENETEFDNMISSRLGRRYEENITINSDIVELNELIRELSETEDGEKDEKDYTGPSGGEFKLNITGNERLRGV